MVDTEMNIIGLVKEFLEYYQFSQSYNCFTEESRIFQGVNVENWRPASDFKRKQQVLDLIKANKKDEFFSALLRLVPESLLQQQEFMRLEFDINLFFLTGSWQKYNTDERQTAMQEFKRYLETKGSVHSQNTEFLAYYALPYVPKPNEHPIYQQLFEETWRNSVISRLSKFIDSIIQPNSSKTPRLINLVTRPNIKQDRLVKQLSSELSDAEKRAAQSQKRFAKLQTDYQTLISVTADILDALESSLKGRTLDSSVMQKIYSRLVHSQHNANIRLSDQHSQPNQTPDNKFRCEAMGSLTASRKTESLSEKPSANGVFYPDDTMSIPLFELDYHKIKDDIKVMNDRKKCYLLQALRWRLTKSKLSQRENCLTSFVRNDILDLTKIESLKDVDLIKHAPLLHCLKSKHHRVREYMARFINALASLSRGRAYLSQTSSVVEILIDEVRKEQDECITRENFVGALQKMSLRRPMQTVMIKQGVILWVTNLLENMNNLSDYTLEYAVALCMNLCLRSSGKRCCVPITGRLLNVLMDLLGIDNIDIVPYVNGALYSILSLPEIRKTAEKMNLKHILKNFIKPDQPEMNRQFDFIIQRLNSSEQPPAEDSDDDAEDDDDEEDASILEADLDRQDLPAPDLNDLVTLSGSQTILHDPCMWVGEGLLKHHYSMQTMIKGEVNDGMDQCKSLYNKGNEIKLSNNNFDNNFPLQRPTTPGQRSSRNSICENHPSTSSKSQPPRISNLTNHFNEEMGNQYNLRDSLATITQSFTEEITPRCKTPTVNGYLCKEIHTHDVNGRKVKKIIVNRQEDQGVFESRPKISRTPDSNSPREEKKFTWNNSNNNNNNHYDKLNEVDIDDGTEAEESVIVRSLGGGGRRHCDRITASRHSPDSTVSSSTHKYDKSIIRNSLHLNDNDDDYNDEEIFSHYSENIKSNNNGTVSK